MYEDVYCNSCGQEVCQSCGCCCNPSCESASCPETPKEEEDDCSKCDIPLALRNCNSVLVTTLAFLL